jgi:hypothetical protein
MFHHFTLRLCGFPFVEIKDVSSSEDCHHEVLLFILYTMLFSFSQIHHRMTNSLFTFPTWFSGKVLHGQHELLSRATPSFLVACASSTPTISICAWLLPCPGLPCVTLLCAARMRVHGRSVRNHPTVDIS